MSLSIEQFDEFFHAINGYAPFPWQSRLAHLVYAKGWPDCIDLPTASGKTACTDIAVFVLACQAERSNNKRTVGRRIFFTVNRRVIVDEAFIRAKKLAEALLLANTGIIKEVADALRTLNEDKTVPLEIAQLRGGIFRDSAWARSLTQPIVICTTADQLGSRLLFRGYGVSDSMKPIHAALAACDSLVLLDEAHVTKAFSQTMQLLTKYQQMHTSAAPLRFVQMTATPAGEVTEGKRFDLRDENWQDPLNKKLKERQDASKPAVLIKLDKKKSVVVEIVSQAVKAISDTRKAVGIIVNRVQTAREIAELIRVTTTSQKIEAEVHLVIGRMRPLDRDELQSKLRKIVGPDRPTQLDKPVFIVATQCLEVGADYDFDALITECASIDALRQRFGRLNRAGREIEAFAAIVAGDDSIQGDDPIYGDAIKHTFNWLLSKKENSVIDFGIGAFEKLWDGVDRELRKQMLAPAPDAAVLLPAHLDALCQTAPQPEPSPEVSYFIHGPQRDNTEVSVCWRADLGDNDDTANSRWPDIVRLLPPTSLECMTVPLREVRRWMSCETKPPRDDADVPVAEVEEEKSKGVSAQDMTRRVVFWRGSKDVGTTVKASELRPGDTVVIPAECRNWNVLGFVPTPSSMAYLRKSDETEQDYRARCIALDRAIDIAELATLQSRRRVVVRIHSSIAREVELHNLNASDLRARLVQSGTIPETWTKDRVARFERHQYPSQRVDSPNSKVNEVIVFSRLVDIETLRQKAIRLAELSSAADDDNDDEDSRSESDRRVSLDSHTKHVEERANASSEFAAGSSSARLYNAAARLHDLGKADVRFQAILGGVTPYEAMAWPTLLAKSDQRKLTPSERDSVVDRARYPKGFRHEMLSLQIVDHHFDQLVTEDSIDRELLLHLISAHHGYARPFAPVVIDPGPDDLLSLEVRGVSVTQEARLKWVPAHRLDSSVADRFWNLTRKHGWWGLAYLESILRLADQQASAAEQDILNGDKP